jgi:hypothetical protein
VARAGRRQGAHITLSIARTWRITDVGKDALWTMCFTF